MMSPPPQSCSCALKHILLSCLIKSFPSANSLSADSYHNYTSAPSIHTFITKIWEAVCAAMYLQCSTGCVQLAKITLDLFLCICSLCAGGQHRLWWIFLILLKLKFSHWSTRSTRCQRTWELQTQLSETTNQSKERIMEPDILLVKCRDPNQIKV